MDWSDVTTFLSELDPKTMAMLALVAGIALTARLAQPEPRPVRQRVRNTSSSTDAV